MSDPAALDDDLLRSFPLPAISEDGDKETRGRVLVIAGSRELPGAAILAGIVGVTGQRKAAQQVEVERLRLRHRAPMISSGSAVIGARSSISGAAKL